MNWYRLYIDSVGGGVICEGPEEFRSERSALEEAYYLAIDDYESFEGYHGIPDIGDIMDNPEEYGLDADAAGDDCWSVYYEQREDWLSYWVEEASGLNDIDEDYQ